MMVHKRADASVTAGDDPGVFDLLLSSSATDRDGERLLPGQWKQPLPASIPLNIDHSGSVSDVIGSGQPWIDADGNLRVSGRWASTDKAQEVRTLVNEGHVIACSVEFLRSTFNGKAVNELTGGALVLTPANPEAVVVFSKGVPSLSVFRELVAKAAAGEDVSLLVQAIHDASVHLGAGCVQMTDEDAESGESEGANKAAALRLRLKASLGR